MLSRTIGMEDLILSLFLSGLKMEIQRELLVDKLPTLSEATAKAKLIEAKYSDIWSKFDHFPPKDFSTPGPFSASTHTGFTANTTPKPNPKPTHVSPSPALPIKHLTPIELQAKGDRGLCYNRDEKYQPNHRCKSKLLGTDYEDY